MRTMLAAAMTVAVVVASLFAAGGCAHDVMTRFPAPPSGDTGSLVIMFGQPASDVIVTIDGWLVVDGAHSARVVVDGVPTGTRDVIVAANGVDKQFRVWISGDHATTVPLGVPDGGVSFLKTIAATAITLLLYSWLKV